MRPEFPPRPTTGTVDSTPRRRRRLLPALLIGAVIVVIAAQEIPAVGALLKQWFKPAEWQASQACAAAALALAAHPEHARVVDPGTAHATQTGHFIEAIVIGEMADAGGERRFRVACYTDGAGKVVRADRSD